MYGLVFCVEFQRVPLKFNTKYLTHSLKGIIFYNAENLSAVTFNSLRLSDAYIC